MQINGKDQQTRYKKYLETASNSNNQGSHVWKVLEFFWKISKTWKVLENDFGPGFFYKHRHTNDT